jgi:3-oxoacyl-[acyl-carrier-protein] synthase II
MRRVVVTGLGLVTPLADGVEASWQALLAGKSAIRKIYQVRCFESFLARLLAEVPAW